MKINWSGLCASDKSLLHDEWADFGVAMAESTKGIAGHEGAGVVVAVGDGMDHKWKVGDRAGIKVRSYSIAGFTNANDTSGLRMYVVNANSVPTVMMNCTVPSRPTPALLLQAPSSNTALLVGNTLHVFQKA